MTGIGWDMLIQIIGNTTNEDVEYDSENVETSPRIALEFSWALCTIYLPTMTLSVVANRIHSACCWSSLQNAQAYWYLITNECFRTRSVTEPTLNIVRIECWHWCGLRWLTPQTHRARTLFSFKLSLNNLISSKTRLISLVSLTPDVDKSFAIDFNTDSRCRNSTWPSYIHLIEHVEIWCCSITCLKIISVMLQRWMTPFGKLGRDTFLSGSLFSSNGSLSQNRTQRIEDNFLDTITLPQDDQQWQFAIPV